MRITSSLSHVGKPWWCLISVIVALISTVAHAQSCAGHVGIRLVTSTTTFSGTSGSLSSTTVQTVGQFGENTPENGVSITCVYDNVIRGVVSTSNGAAVVSGFSVTNANASVYFYTSCGSMARLGLTFSIPASPTVVWLDSFESSVTSTGELINKPRLGLQMNGVRHELDTTQAWELRVSHSGLQSAMRHYIGYPNPADVAFPDLAFDISNGMFNGASFTLSLHSIGGQVSGVAPYVFPASKSMTVAHCDLSDHWRLNEGGATLSDWTAPSVVSGSKMLNFRGWKLPFSLAANGRCRFDGGSYPCTWTYLDVCNVQIAVSITTAIRKALIEFSFDSGVNYYPIGMATLIDSVRQLSVSPGIVVPWSRDQIVQQRVTFTVVDSLSSPVGNVMPSGAHQLVCTTTSVDAPGKRINTRFLDPEINALRTPVVDAYFYAGFALEDFVFGNYLSATRHTYCCSVPSYGITSPVCVNFDVSEDCPSPPSIVSIAASPTLCTLAGNGDLNDCYAQGITLTVIGVGFGMSSARVRVGALACQNVAHDVLDPTARLIASGCTGTGGATPYQVMIETAAGKYSLWSKVLRFRLGPTIVSVTGCPRTLWPSTTLCRNDGTSMVQISGSNFGSSGAHVYFYSPIAGVARITAATVTHLDAGGTLLNATAFPGTGEGLFVAVEAVAGGLTIASDVTMSFVPSVSIPCPGTSPCNGHGTCNTATGICTCNNDATGGFWTGAACDACQARYWGSACLGICPGGISTPCTNPSQGVCSEGVAGSGLCICSAGWAGTACQTACPGGTSAPCNNRGTCVQAVDPPVCNCLQDNVAGYWGSSACSTCSVMYTGASCTQQCPTHVGITTPCSGHGTCASTASGAVCTCTTGYCGADCYQGTGCGSCPVGYFGASCASQCPGYNAGLSTVCTGHGLCSQGQQGSGLCSCDPGFAGSACELQCPGSPICSAHGSCDIVTGNCVCDTFYAGSACQTSCPGLGTPGGVCSSHGVCTGGTCVCSSGYTGVNCDLICAGGVATPCNFHGACNLDASCTCSASLGLGYWQGSVCNTCAVEYYGPNCNEQCPKTNNVQCAGHGQCTPSVICDCAANAADGFWAEPLCATCKPNYFGAQCRRQCPGGACNACSGNGICSDGTSGTGLCSCFANATHGYWAGDKCNQCQPSYFGASCTSPCPTSSGSVCGGHGICADGVGGTGVCTCSVTAGTGYWGGVVCDACDPGYYGASCTQPCNGLGTDGPCTGHGTCDSGFAGTGTCTCSANWGTASCAVGCPVVSGSLCSGHGTCSSGAAGTGTCTCFSSNALGRWAGAGCDDCQDGYFAATCTSECPRSAGLVCAGHGSCDSGPTASGTCSCTAGWSGPGCSRPCDGGAVNPCSGQGTCDPATGRCTCFASPSLGYWAGRNCSVCSALYTSDGCRTACPVASANPTVACNGHGSCQNGGCVCSTGYCGSSCQDSGFTCSNDCPSGRFGSDCQRECPGSGTCNGHGSCNQGKLGTGLCTCFTGYWSDSCSGTCPGVSFVPEASTCSGHGSCSQSTGLCSCTTGYASSDCSVVCPGGVSNPCNGHGTCNAATATCTCQLGWAALDCGTACPGNYTNPCSGNGVCNQNPVSCTCNNDASNGFFTGTTCGSCKSGYYGTRCSGICVNGVTTGTVCVCNNGYSGAGCTHPCPGLLTNNLCSGHGTCRYGSQYETSSCVCQADYYTTDCSVHCTATQCRSQPYYLVNGRCSNQTGQCGCIDDDVDGHWGNTATRCTTCKLFYYGDKCTRKCPCLQRGGCEKTSGTCQCFDTDGDGHYAGVSCERCKSGYLGQRCTGKDVVITRQKPCSTAATVQARSSFLLFDTTRGVILTGGRPVVICNASTRSLIKRVDMGCTVISGIVTAENEYLFTITGFENSTSSRTTTSGGSNATNASSSSSSTSLGWHQNVRVSRNNVLQILGRGNKFQIDSANATTSRGRSFAAEEVQEQTEGEAEGENDHLSQNAVATAGASSRRLLQVYTALTAPITVATIDINSNERLLVTSAGIVSYTRGLDVVSQISLASYLDTTTTADIMTSVLIETQQMFVGGVKSGRYVLITVSLPLSTSSVVQDITSTVTSKTAFCTTYTCQGVGRLVCDGTFVLFMMHTEDTNGLQGIGLLRFRYTTLFAGGRVEANIMLDKYVASTIFNVTAMLLDPLGGAGFVAINSKSSQSTDPSTIYKFDLLDLQLYGTVRFQKVVDTYEIVASLTKNDESRMLYASIPLTTQVNVVPLSLYAVTKLYPNVADTVGGTIITVFGEGFVDDPSFKCNFSGTLAAATYVSSREATCVAPTGGDERCQGVPLEVSIGPSQYTKNEIPIRRVSTPRISSVYVKRLASLGWDNAYGNLTGGDAIVAQGTGFQDTPFIACRFGDVKKENHIVTYADREYIWTSGTQGVRTMAAKYVNSTHVECVQPAFSKPTQFGKSTLEVSLDGNIYSRSSQPFDVIDNAVGFRVFKLTEAAGRPAWTPSANDVYASVPRLELPTMHFFTVDREGQRLRTLDRVARTVTVELVAWNSSLLMVGNSPFDFSAKCEGTRRDPTAPVFYTSGAKTLAMADGYVNFTGIYFQSPPAGYYTLRFLDNTSQWEYNYTFRVRTGKAAVLKICRQPSNVTDNTNPTLTQQPILYVEDKSGNMLSSEDLVGLIVEAHYVHESTSTSALTPNAKKTVLGVPVNVTRRTTTLKRSPEISDNLLVFQGIDVIGLYGSQYRITFSSPGAVDDASSTATAIDSVMSRNITLKWCPNNAPAILKGDYSYTMFFAKVGTSECFVCPEAGLCDGTNVVQLLDNNYWRPDSGSYYFYPCTLLDSASNACVRPQGTCLEGYEGPRCSVCKKGYGKQFGFCQPCPNPAIIGTYLALLMAIALAFVGAFVYSSFSATRADYLPIVVRIAINHLQISSRINDMAPLPQLLRDLFAIQQQISELIRIDVVASECKPLELTVYGKFYAAMVLPLACIFVFALFYGCLAIFRTIRGAAVAQEAAADGTAAGATGATTDGPAAGTTSTGDQASPAPPPAAALVAAAARTTTTVTAGSKKVRRDRVMLRVAQFMGRLKAAVESQRHNSARDDEREQQFTCKEYLGATVFVILFLVYPSVLQWCTLMWSCDPIAFGDADTFRVVSYLRIDRSVVCTDPSHRLIQIISVTAAAAYGIVIPLVAIGSVWMHWRSYGRVHARRLFGFLTAGYSRQRWYWEIIVAIRKAVIVFIIAFVDEPTLRVYLCMWAVSTALALHGFLRPYDAEKPALHYLEGLGLTSIVLTLNLSLLFSFPLFAEGEWPFYLLVVGLFTINVLVVALFLFFLVRTFVQRFKRWREGKSNTAVAAPPAPADSSAAVPPEEKYRGIAEYRGTSAESVERPRTGGDLLPESAASPQSRPEAGLIALLQSEAKQAAGVPKDPSSPADQRVDLRDVPQSEVETPYERLRRVEATLAAAKTRDERLRTKSELERELDDLRDRLIKAQALAAAEEAITGTNVESQRRRQQHEEAMYKLLDDIRRDRGFSTGLKKTAGAKKSLTGSRDGEGTVLPQPVRNDLDFVDDEAAAAGTDSNVAAAEGSTQK